MGRNSNALIWAYAHDGNADGNGNGNAELKYKLFKKAGDVERDPTTKQKKNIVEETKKKKKKGKKNEEEKGMSETEVNRRLGKTLQADDNGRAFFLNLINPPPPRRGGTAQPGAVAYGKVLPDLHEYISKHHMEEHYAKEALLLIKKAARDKKLREMLKDKIVKELVAFLAKLPREYPDGTMVSKEFEEDGTGEMRLYEGSVKSYDPETGMYDIEYEHGVVEVVGEDKVDNIVVATEMLDGEGGREGDPPSDEASQQAQNGRNTARAARASRRVNASNAIQQQRPRSTAGVPAPALARAAHDGNGQNQQGQGGQGQGGGAGRGGDASQEEGDGEEGQHGNEPVPPTLAPEAEAATPTAAVDPLRRTRSSKRCCEEEEEEAENKEETDEGIEMGEDANAQEDADAGEDESFSLTKQSMKELIAEKNETIASKDEELAAKDEELEAKDQRIAALVRDNANKNREYASLKEELTQEKNEIITSKDEELAAKDEELEAKDQRIAALMRDNASKNRENASLKARLKNSKPIIDTVDLTSNDKRENKRQRTGNATMSNLAILHEQNQKVKKVKQEKNAAVASLKTATEDKRAVEADLEEAKADLGDAEKLASQQAVFTNTWQNKFEEVVALIPPGQVDGASITAIRNRPVNTRL